MNTESIISESVRVAQSTVKSRVFSSNGLRALTTHLFVMFVALALVTPSWRVGLFTWWPIHRFPMVAGAPMQLGVLSMLPITIIACWIALRLFGQTDSWQWGSRGITWPLLGLTLLVLLGLEPGLTWRTTVLTGALGLTWFVYLFLINERPATLVVALMLILVVQSIVAIGQFTLQHDLGLQALGELSLDPMREGTSVLVAQGRPWLRAYGLTGHPNVLGAMLAVLLLMLVPAVPRTSGWQKAAVVGIFSVGILGLLVTFCRAAWLAFGLGLVLWVWTNRAELRRVRPMALFYTVLVVGVLFLGAYHDLIFSRFLDLTNAVEIRSIRERLRDSSIALELIATHPWRGVGAGNELVAAQRLYPGAATVHNVPLLVAAELGIGGVLLWGWLAIVGLRVPHPGRTAWAAMLLVGLFDNTLWPLASWRAAILFGLLTALVSADVPLVLATGDRPDDRNDGRRKKGEKV